MSGYTPTTEQVRDSIRTWEISEQAFDRWLAEVERAAAEKALSRVRSTIGAYTEHGVWAFDQAVNCIEREDCRHNEGENDGQILDR